MERPARPVRADLPRRVAVVGGSRIPFARSDGPYATTSNQDMLTAALDGLATRYGLRAPGAVGEFVAGAVLQHSRDFTLARETLSAPHSTRALRRTTSSRPAAPGSRP
jgi:acetyl-CoA C-acetyltransferase